VPETAEVLNESLLIEKAKKRDTAAFSALVKRHQERALHVAYSFLGNREDARDAAQEAFVKAYESLSSFKGGSQFSTWLHRILVNVCKDTLRKKIVRKNLAVTRREPDEDEEKTRAEDKVASHYPSARDQMVSRELGGAIREAMETLPPQQRSAFALRYLEGLSLAEIAETLKLSEGAVKAHVWQAAQKMQKLLSSYAGEKK
jgi:RNA polymerase sigma-70 factor (ECF subfamily)